MKVRIRIFGVACVFLTLFGVQSFWGQAPLRPCPNVSLVMWEPDVSRWSQPSRDQVLMTIERLQQAIDRIPPRGPLTPAIIRQIVDVYGANGNLTGHDGLTYKGDQAAKNKIPDYLRANMGAISDFSIEIKAVYAKEFTSAFKNVKNPNDNDVVHSLYFIFSNSFLLNGHLVDPPGSTNCPHIRICECDRSR